MMTSQTGAMPPAGAPQQVLTRSRYVLLFVDQSIEALIAQSRGNTVVVPETTLIAWQTLLMSVVSQLNTLPVPAIFPPPRWAQLVQMAVRSINAALQILAAIPVAATLIFPPQPGQASVNVRTLRQVQANVRAAEQALTAAQAELGAG